MFNSGSLHQGERQKIVVIVEGPDSGSIKSKAGKSIEFLGYQLLKIICKSKSFVFAAEKDFEIIPIDAQGCGNPVIAYSRGGALETVMENKCGIFCTEQCVERLVEAVDMFEKEKDKFDCS